MPSARRWLELAAAHGVPLSGGVLAASEAQLREAGAVAVERAGESLIIDATAELVEAWSPAYLAATRRLRGLVWPWSFQHPLDDPKRKPRG